MFMNTSNIYSRLQHDVSSILGLNLQLDISRAPHYERLWKDVLLAIEYIGPKDYCTYCLGVDGNALSLDDCISSCSHEQDVTALIITYPESVVSTTIQVPAELVSLVTRFLVYRNPIDLRLLRQICLFVYKSKSHEVTQDQEEIAIQGFRSRNAACLDLSYHFYKAQALKSDEHGAVLRLARVLANIVINKADFRDIVPKHGPGAVSDAKRGYTKWTQLDSRCTRLCDKYYPISDWFVPTPAWFNHEQACYAASVCKLAIVPKDRRGPRIICTQPTGLMWIQQGQLRGLNKAIESSAILKVNRLYDGNHMSSIKFDDQTQNGSLALESSRTREFATIDLKDASDLISWGLVRFLFNKENVKFLAASRAMYVRVPTQELVKLHMFAPMGSAMCFPVESLVFWCVAAAATYVQRGVTDRYLTGGSATKFLRSNPSEVFVFGDDVLVRREACKFVCERFESLGFKPNYNKTFAEGFYRESCGVDAYLGVRLDIARLQCLTLTSMSDAYATIDLANRARRLCMISLADYLEAQIESFLGFRLAAGLYGGGLLVRDWPSDEEGPSMALSWNMRRRKKIRFNADLQLWEAQTVIASPLDYVEAQDGRYRLFRGLTSGVDEHTADWLKPDNMQYHLGWVRAF